MKDPVKRKKYVVETRSHVSADMIVFANTKQEAWETASKDMEESLKRQLKNAVPNPFIKNLDGYTEVLKSTVKQII